MNRGTASGDSVRTVAALYVEKGGCYYGLIESVPAYFDIACKRIEDAQRQGDFFIGEAA